MGKERRRQTRYLTEFESSLYLCNGANGHRLSVSLGCRVVDFSRLGAGIISKEIFVDNQHFFYAALDSEKVLLCVEITVPEDEGGGNVLNFIGRPVWFDRVHDQEQSFFKMGIEFLEKVAGDKFQLIRQHGVAEN